MACEKIAVAGIQIPQVMGNREANISNAIKAISEAPGHDIYVLPELSSSGYGVDVFRALEVLAEDIEGPSYKAFSGPDGSKRRPVLDLKITSLFLPLRSLILWWGFVVSSEFAYH